MTNNCLLLLLFTFCLFTVSLEAYSWKSYGTKGIVQRKNLQRMKLKRQMKIFSINNNNNDGDQETKLDMLDDLEKLKEAAKVIKSNQGNKGFGASKTSFYDKAREHQYKELVQVYANDPNRRVIEDTVQFPSSFVMKVIGLDEDGTLTVSVIETIQKVLRESSPHSASTEVIAVPPTEKTIPYSIKRSTNNKNLISITVTPFFQHSSQVYDVYEVLGKDKRIKMVL